MARAHPRKDWAALKAAYRRGEGSIAELAPRFGIPKSTAEKRCAREKWQVERQELAQKAEERAVERDVETVAQMLVKHRRAAALAGALVMRELELGAGKGGMAASRLDLLTRTLARMAPMERLAAGLEQSKPVQGGSGEGPRTRIVYRNGAAVPPAAPERASPAPVVPIAGKAGAT